MGEGGGRSWKAGACYLAASCLVYGALCGRGKCGLLEEGDRGPPVGGRAGQRGIPVGAREGPSLLLRPPPTPFSRRPGSSLGLDLYPPHHHLTFSHRVRTWFSFSCLHSFSCSTHWSSSLANALLSMVTGFLKDNSPCYSP